MYGSILHQGNTSPSSPKAQWSHTQNRKTTILGDYSIQAYAYIFVYSGREGGGGDIVVVDHYFADESMHDCRSQPQHVRKTQQPAKSSFSYYSLLVTTVVQYILQRVLQEYQRSNDF